MKKTIALFLFCLVAVLAQAQTEPRHEVELVTDSGTIRLVLYNETPRHRDNFLKQVQSGAYNGVLAAAREGDNVNPERASSSTQFYIVWGQKFTDKQLEWAQERMDKYTDGKAKLTPELIETYKTQGGTPHLDGSYTVFGEVVDGLGVVEKIQKAATDGNDRPVNDIRIISAKVIK